MRAAWSHGRLICRGYLGSQLIDANHSNQGEHDDQFQEQAARRVYRDRRTRDRRGRTPAVALAASHPAHAKVVKSDPASPDKPRTKDGTSRDTKVDRSSSVDRSTGVDKNASVDLKTDH